ncbi:hypothetical protein [Escherichia coli]|uniref:hypothetical protein n=1 Tax=Escherichia coli TaxID=562 RepID=UPI000DD8E389|nr:hypothetical protein [Escherichia coli]
MKKIILSALACTALLTGCVSQDKGNAMQSQLNNQQRQINELSVRLQSAESRLSKLSTPRCLTVICHFHAR